MEILEKILGNSSRVKIMRLFLLNRGKGFKSKDIAKRSRVSADAVRKEIKLLSSVGFIKKRSKVSLDWYFNSLFKYAEEFEDLLVRSDSLNRQQLLNNFKNVGRIKLLVVSGVFIKNHSSRVDLLIVGDNMKRSKIEAGVKRLEAEIGSELVYAIFSSKDFTYRLSMYDKLVRDILDYPHEVLLQSRELSTQALKKV
ncbi:MAG: HTH domain-containing protein [Patescibacteria group bacterium]